MKKLVSLFLLVIMLCGVNITRAGGVPQSADVVSEDSTISVIGWFFNHDTISYCIQEGKWKIVPHDTIQTMGTTTRVMITVADSTASGYKMDYTIQHFSCDSLPNGEMYDLQKSLVDIYNKALAGNTIRFETDECGKITRFEDLGKLKKKAKGIFKDFVKEMESVPTMKEAKKNGFDIKALLKNIDTDVIVDGILEDINLLFMYHGLAFDMGETRGHEDATEIQYENDSYTFVGKEDNGLYFIEDEIVNIVPVEDVKAMVSGMAGAVGNKELADIMKDDADIMFFNDGIIGTYLRFDYIPEGWPFKVLKQQSTIIDNKGRLSQKYIFFTTPFTGD